MYTYKINKDDITVMLNKYGMKMIECIRGTNCTEAYHKGLVQVFGSWPCGLEMSDCLLMEHRHRHGRADRRSNAMPFSGCLQLESLKWG